MTDIVPAGPWAVGAVGEGGRAWAPHGFGQSKAWQPGHIPCPSKGVEQLGASGQPQPWCLPRDRDRPRPGCTVGLHRFAWFKGAHGWAGQAYRELETNPSAESLRQGLRAPGGLNWCPGPWTTII